MMLIFFFFSSRRRHTRYIGDWSSDVCSSDLSNLISEISFNEDSVLEDVLAILKDTSEDEVNADFSNEAYGDLMALVMKHKRSEERRVGKECRYRWWRYY